MKKVLICGFSPIAAHGMCALLSGTYEVSDSGLLPTDRSESVVIVEAGNIRPSKIIGWLELYNQEPSLPVAVIAWGNFPPITATLLFRSGVKGFLRTYTDLATIHLCVNLVADGGAWMDGGVPSPVDGRCINTLTARELQVFELVQRGMKNKDIGAQLGIRTGTVKIHLKHIFEKTGFRDRYALWLAGLRGEL